jgi:hypothetical protein
MSLTVASMGLTSYHHPEADDWEVDDKGYLTIYKTGEVEVPMGGLKVKQSTSEPLALYAPAAWAYVVVEEEGE